MDKRYQTLFTEIIKSVEILAEQAMEIEHNNKEDENSAMQMRELFATLHDKMTASDFNPSSLNRSDYAKILIGAIIAAEGISRRVEKEQRALEGYKIDTIPKLNRIINETKTDEEAKQLAEEIFTISI